MSTTDTMLERFTKKIDKYLAQKKADNSDSEPKLITKIEQYNKLLKEEFHIIENGRFVDRKDIVKGLQTRIKNKDKNVAVVLGAGVSCGAPFDLPSWSKLLQRAVVGDFLTYYDTDGVDDGFDDIITMLTKSDEYSGDYFESFDLYELAQILEEARHQREQADNRQTPREELRHKVDCNMYETVRYALCRGLSQDWKKVPYKTNYYVYEQESNTSIQNTLLWKLGEFIQSHSNVRHVITYNYDNAFEYMYERVDNSREVSPVFIDDQLGLIKPECFPVYHVHGYTPIFNTKELQEINFQSAIDSSEGKRLILSENSYDDIEHSSYKWRNTVQIDSFLKYNCLFFGFSATDKNFKRIVKLMDWHTEQYGAPMQLDDKDRILHYIFLTVDDFINNIFGTTLERLTQNDEDTQILISPGRYKKRVRHVMFSLLDNLKALRDFPDIKSDAVCKDIETAIKYIDELLKNDALKYYCDGESDDYDLPDVKFKENEEKPEISLLSSIPAIINNIIQKITQFKDEKTIDDINKKTIVDIKRNMERSIIDFEGGEARLALRLEFLYYTLQSKRRYLRKMHIYPLWITAKDSATYIDKFLLQSM